MVFESSFGISSRATLNAAGFVLLVLGMFAVLPSLRAADIEFVTQELPWAIADKPYSPPPLAIRASGRCPSGGIGFSVVGGEVPPGLELSKLGYFSGTPLRTGEFGFGIRASNGCTWAAKRFTLTVTGAPVLTVSPEKLRFDGAGEKHIQVSATWPKLSYSVTSSADWLKVSPVHGFTPRASSALSGDDVDLASLKLTALNPGHYAAWITFAAWQVLDPATVVVDLDLSTKHESSGIPTSASPSP